MQYRLPQWQCERTGRADLTYDQAKESENAQNSRAEYRFSFGLAKRVFQSVQFSKSSDILDMYPSANKKYLIIGTRYSKARCCRRSRL